MESSSILELSQKRILAFKNHSLPLSDPPHDIFQLASREFKIKRGWGADLSGLADMEIENQFPILHSHNLVELWSGLESLAEDVLANHQKHNPKEFTEEEINKLRSEKKKGICRILWAYKILRIDVPIGKKLSEIFTEMWEIRNVIVHRASVVDDKLTEKCPWLGLNVGDKIKINFNQLEGYYKAVFNFVNQIISKFGNQLKESLQNP